MNRTVMTAGILILAGLFHLTEGMNALINDDFFMEPLRWAFEFDLASWGLIHLLAGVIAIPAGIGLIAGAERARTVAVVVTALCIITNFLWAPYYPWWSLLANAFDLFVLWAVTMHGAGRRNTVA